VVIGSVRGDLHDIGKNLVAMMLEGAGFEITDLGSDVWTETFVEAVERSKPDLLCLSALLTTTLPMMEEAIGALKEAELRQNVRIMVGGAPLTDELAAGIGADGFVPDAVTAVELAKALMGTE
jgi:methanogenic corrinoid protein MtbC1